MKKTPAFIILLLFFVMGPAGACRNKPTGYETVLRGLTMGTTYTIRVIDRNLADTGRSDRQRLQNSVSETLAEVNRQMSVFRPDSEISTFNRLRDGGWFPVSADTATVVKHALEISRLSGGAFDVTVAPLIDLWGFGPGGPLREPPDEAAISAARARCGWEKLRVRLQPPALRKISTAITCNLSAIAKGFGVDRIGSLLSSYGYLNYLIEIGGEVSCRGLNKHGQPWNIGIENPGSTFPHLQTTVRLQDAAMATSGDYHNYFEKNGIRYSHTIDPLSGRPITHALASVTVVAATCMHADAMATAINVLGPEKGFELAERENIAVFLIIHEGYAFAQRRNRAFSRLLPGG